MDFHELEAFVALAKHLHFAKAAQEVHTSPSALSRMILRLEDECGVRFFDRDTRRVSLREEGEAFLDFARTVLERKNTLHGQLDSRDGELRGTLKVYASVTACYTLLPPLVTALGSRHPGLHLLVETGDPADAPQAILEGMADCGLAAIPEGGFKEFQSYLVASSPLVLVANRTGKFGELSWLTMTGSGNWSRWQKDAFAELPLIVPHKGLGRRRLERWGREAGIPIRYSAEASGNEAILALAHLGLGVGMVPQIVVENSPFAQGLTMYPLAGHLGEHHIGFILPRPMRQDIPRLQAVRELLPQVYPAGRWIASRNSGQAQAEDQEDEQEE